MSNYTHKTAPTQFVEAAGIRFAYRRFGAKIDIPLLFFMHFTGTMDHWDPAVTDGFAQDREVILFNNAGVSSSTGEVPTSIEEMAHHAATFIDALGVKNLDALGFSIGGFVAQQFTMDRPDLVRKLILVGTGPRGGEGMASLTPEGQEIFGAKYDPADELWLRALFTPSERSQAAGSKYLERQRGRKENRDPLPNEKVAPAQLAALQKWGAPEKDPYAYLKKITQPTLIFALMDGIGSLAVAPAGGLRLPIRALHTDGWPNHLRFIALVRMARIGRTRRGSCDYALWV